LGICSQAICQVFICAVIHTTKHLTGYVLSCAIHSVGTIL
jgi:hypothetical protein